MELPRLQYITHPLENFNDLSWVHRLADGGVEWIQLRIKEEDFIQQYPTKHFLAEFHETADKLRAITNALGMLLTINDEAEVARFSFADGIHLGQDDLGQLTKSAGMKITGGTANSFGEMKKFDPFVMSYFGVGPLRFTATKSALKPVLGFEGYKALIAEMGASGYSQPVYAIGGVKAEDISPLLDSGVYGIAVSSAFYDAGHSVAEIQRYTNQFKRHVI